jgi:L-asparaginase
VLSSRAGAGEPLRATYDGFAGSEMDMMRRGVISSGALDGPKSRVLLTFLLANHADGDEIRRAFGRHGLYRSPS